MNSYNKEKLFYYNPKRKVFGVSCWVSGCMVAPAPPIPTSTVTHDIWVGVGSNSNSCGSG